MDDLPRLMRIPPGRHRLSKEFVAAHQRERLFVAIVELVARKGYPATSLTEIVKTAGVARHTFYEHFADKEELFLAVFDEAIERVFSVLVAAGEAESGPWEAKLRASLTALFEGIADQPELARAWLIESQSAGPAAVEHYEAALHRLAGLLRVGRSIGPRGAELPDSTEDIVAGGLIWMIDKRLSDGDPEHLRERLMEALPGAMEFILSPYLGEAAARKAATPER